MALFGIGKSERASSILEMGKTILKDAQEKGILGKQASVEDASESEEDSSVIDKGKDMLKGVAIAPVRVAIKGSGAVIRKIYETRINVVNEFSDIKPDWGFVDEDTVKKEIKRLEKELKSAIRELKSSKGSLQAVNERLDELVMQISLVDNNLSKCDKMIAEHHLATPFAVYGMKCLKADAMGNADEAVGYARQYYEMNGNRAEHPRIAFYAAKALSSTGQYKAALYVAASAVKSYPESAKVHELLSDLHSYMGNQPEADLERNIAGLLKH